MIDLGYGVKARMLPGVVTLEKSENIIHLSFASIKQLKGMVNLSEPPDEMLLLNYGVRVTYGGNGYYMLQVPDNAIMLSTEQLIILIERSRC